MVKARKDTQGWNDDTIAVVDTPVGEPPIVETIVGNVIADVAPPQVLDLEHFKLGPVGLEVKGRPNFDEWKNIGGLLRLMEHGIQWLIGDWVNWGEGEWGDKTAQVIDAELFSESTIRVYRWTAARIPTENRVPALTFSHHMAVSSMVTTEQQRWLERATKNTWSVSELKKQIKIHAAGSTTTTTDIEYLVIVKCETELDQQECARQLTNLNRTFTIKTKGTPVTH